jgi:SPP1 family predicted phage head-tail adaptor
MAIRKTQHSNIGKLNKLATIQTYTNVSDGMGGFTTTWANDGTIWCDIMPLSGAQRLEYGNLNTDISHKITARYNASLTPEKRLTYSGRTFTLRVAINKGEDSDFMELLASEES